MKGGVYRMLTTVLCYRFPEHGRRLRGSQFLFQRLHRPERHHPYTAAGRAEREVFGIRGFYGLSFFPHAPDEELPDHARP